MAHGRGGANRFVRALRVLLLFVRVGRFRKIVWTVFFADVLANFGDGFRGNPDRVGTHVGNQTDRTLFAEFHAFVEALRDHHGAFHAEAELARGVLLELAGGKWRRGIAAAFFLVDRADDPLGFFQSDADLFRFLAIRDLDLLFTFA